MIAAGVHNPHVADHDIFTGHDNHASFSSSGDFRLPKPIDRHGPVESDRTLMAASAAVNTSGPGRAAVHAAMKRQTSKSKMGFIERYLENNPLIMNEPAARVNTQLTIISHVSCGFGVRLRARGRPLESR